MTDNELVKQSGIFAAEYLRGLKGPRDIVQQTNVLNCAGHGFWMGYMNPRGVLGMAWGSYQSESKVQFDADARYAFREGFNAGRDARERESGDPQGAAP